MENTLKKQMENANTEEIKKDMQKARIVTKYVDENFDNHGAIYIDDMKVEVNGNLVDIGLDATKLSLLIENDKKETLKKRLLKIHAEKVRAVQKVITQKDFTRELEKEYMTKTSEAKKAFETNDFSYFELSAQLKKMTSKQYAQLVIDKANSMLEEENQALRKVGDIRSFISDLIDDENTFKAERMLDYMENVKPQIIIRASNEQLIEIIQTYSTKLKG